MPTRRTFLRFLGLAPVAAVAPARPWPDLDPDAPPEAQPWADEWPPTARRGKLIRCDEAPGYYTTQGGIPALFVIGDDAYADHEIGPTGFARDREIDPPKGTHVIEINPDARNEALNGRYAVVR